MPVTGPFDELRRDIERMHGVATGEAAESLEHALRQAAWIVVTTGWRERISPRGTPWRAGKNGSAGNLELSGAMRAALRIEERPNGFAITDRVHASSGALYGGTHQYGRTIKAKGVKTARYKTFGPGGTVRRHTMRGVYNTYGAKPLKWRSPDGKWHSAWKVRVPARPIVPRNGELPTRWERVLRMAANAFLNTRQRSWTR